MEIFFRVYYKIRQKLPGFEIEKNPNFFNILIRGKSQNDWKLHHNRQKMRKVCRIAATCRKNLQKLQSFGH